MTKRITVTSKVYAYTTAIDMLSISESSSLNLKEEADEVAAYKWLANKLDKECQRWYNGLKKT